MKILVIGTGVIGTLTAISLAEHNEITHYVRKSKYNDWNNKTINYDILDERLPKKDRYTNGSYTFRCTDEITETYDLIIMAVNSFQLSNVLQEISGQAPAAKYLLMTLNWEGTAEIDAIIAREQYIMGYASGGGTYRDHGSLLWGNIGDDILLGKAYEEQDHLLQMVNSLFVSSGIKPEIPANIVHALWLHNIGTAPFGIALMKHGSIAGLVADKELVKVCFDAMKECYIICDKRGVNLKDFPEVKMYHMPFFILYPLFKRNITGEVAKRYTAHALSAIEEMKTNFLVMLKSGDELGVEMPNMMKLNQLLS